MKIAGKRYEAVLYTIKGVHTVAYFNRLNDADTWLMKRYEEYRKTRECAAVIYDQHKDRKRVAVIPVPTHRLPFARIRPSFSTCRERLSLKHTRSCMPQRS
jgi:hypothetical protein